MKSFLNLLRWFLGGSVFLGALVTAVPYVVAQKAPVVLPMGAVVIVRIDEQVTGKTHTSGALVKASVARDVVIDNVPVIKIGTPVEVSIAQASKAGAVGQAGAVGINIESTQTVDNQTVFLRGVFSSEGQEKVGTSVGVGVILCPLALLMKGEEGIIKAGTEYQAKTQNAVNVAVPETGN
mgnify:FL=1